jgi:DNA polymerase III delta prime subunit
VLPQEIVGQQLALTQLTDALCHHLSQQRPKKPLVISVHGPPGVGKTYTHLWLARILYNQQPSAALNCPGLDCRGYKVCAAVAVCGTALCWLRQQLVSADTAVATQCLVALLMSATAHDM